MKISRHFVVFVAIGGFSALVNLVSRAVIDIWTSYEVAVVLAFPTGMTTAFLLNRRLVFAAEGSWVAQYARFTLVNLITLVQVFVISVGLARYVFPAIGFTWEADTVAHAIGLASPTVSSYWAHKRFSFASKGGAAAIRRSS